MKQLGILTIGILLFTTISCNTTKQKIIQHAASHDKKKLHWSYSGTLNPNNWSHISDSYLACNGTAQSPINIQTQFKPTKKSHHSLQLNYDNSFIHILNNGHTEEFVISEGNSLIFDGKKYVLKQFHFHTLSEHTIDGKHFPLEIHFVNKSSDDTYLVISVLVKEGPSSNFLAQYLMDFPKKEGEYLTQNKFKIMDVLPSTKHFFHYHGSFTTPPCTESVDWVVLKEYSTASDQQLNQLHMLMHDNFRPIQALNKRILEEQ